MKIKISSVRRCVQVASLLTFTAFFFLTLYPIAPKIPIDSYLQLDPLVGIIASIAGRTFSNALIIGLVVFALTALIGRFFCGYLCPLGALIDIFGRLIPKKTAYRESDTPKSNRRVKYYILATVIAAALVGVNLLHFLSPMAIVPRSFAIILTPQVVSLINSGIDIVRPLLTRFGLDSAAQFTLQPFFFNMALPAFLLFAAILAANYWRRRFWCRYICPSGALLSLVSRFGIVKRKTRTPECNSCRRCSKVCAMHAIDPEQPTSTILSECTLCGNCVDICGRNGVAITIGKFGFDGENASLDGNRRSFIYTAAAGIVGASILKTPLHHERTIEGRLIRPPGALPERDFLARCIRCGQCMKVCKTNGLQPADLTTGLDSLWTPQLVPRHGPCEEKCNMCGQVCPTQAIRPLPMEEKHFVKIGTAVIDRNRCIAWEQDKLCLICDEICPYNAIEFRVVSNFTGPFKRPFVLEDKCTGCGWCEHKCPILGRGAIEVYSIGEERMATGSYITENKKRLRSLGENQESSYSVDDLGSGGETSTNSGTSSQGETRSETTSPAELPGGFITEE